MYVQSVVVMCILDVVEFFALNVLVSSAVECVFALEHIFADVGWMINVMELTDHEWKMILDHNYIFVDNVTCIFAAYPIY